MDNRKLKAADPTFADTLKREVDAYHLLKRVGAAMDNNSERLRIAEEKWLAARTARVEHENRIRVAIGAKPVAVVGLPPIR